MNSFEQVQEKLGELPSYPKVYLLGSTGAGKTSIVRAILDTEADKFPTTLQTRTTVAPTEYVISSKRQYKSTFIFKEKENIENSIVEILVSTILKALSLDNSDEELSVVSYLEETPDERFRLKYLVSSDFLQEINDYIIEELLPSIDTNQSNEELFSTNKVITEIESLVNKVLDAIKETTKVICPDYELFSNELYTIENINDKKEFILKNKALLKSELNSISPLIEYARIEGDLLADWIPNEYEFILIDGEGIGHNLKEIKNSLSTRHLDFFNFSDSILLVEKSDDPFITGGKNAIETIFLNGYSKKFKLIFSKVDKLEVKDYKSALNRRIGNVENALKDSNIRFEVNKNQKYYLSNLDKKGNEPTQKEIIRVFKNIIEEFPPDENTIDLEYDFEELFIGLNTNKFLNNWHSIIDNEHWTIIKALTKRMILQEGEYRYLKPILDYHTLIMKEINSFLKNDNQLNSEVYYAQNQIKQKFSTELLKYIRDEFLVQNELDWITAHNKSGYGSGKERKRLVEKIFNNLIPKDMIEDKYINFKKKIKNYLTNAGAKEISDTIKINIKEIVIDNIYGNRSIKWNLNKDTNILIGKNGSGKSTVLKLIHAKFYNKLDILEKFKNPDIKVTICKEYENGESKEITINDHAHLQKMDIELIDTFDMVSNSISECKENCDKELSLLDSELIKLMYIFNDYQIKLNKIFDENNSSNQLEIRRILDDIGQGKLDEASKIQELTQNKDKIKSEVYESLDKFRNIIDSMFKDTNKKISLESIKKSFSIASKNRELGPLELSSGEKQILIIFLSILLKENKPYILMMDEPENSLHSEWQIHFVNNIRKLNENVQIIIATHNPLLMMDREGDEIGKISIDSDVIDTSGEGTKYMDVSETLLTYPQISSLVGMGEMYKEINQLFKLKKKDVLSPDEKNKVNKLEIKLGKTVASNFIYDRHYLHFLKFIQDNKDIDFDKLTEVSDEEMDELLGEFKDLFDD
ncbi:MAG: AAA family ATPase [Campylobacterota bacterium]|nr:AAA family ATPase [Campylobacterota bacterium]